MRKFFSNTNIDFIGHRRNAYIITAVVFALGIIFSVIRGQNLSIEFTGGTSVEVRTAGKFDVAALRSAIESEGIVGPEIVSFIPKNPGEAAGFTVRARGAKEGVDADNTQLTQEAIASAITTVLGARDTTAACTPWCLTQTAAVGPKVGSELRTDAVRAILLAFLLVLIYLAYRFEWRFGLAAILACSHDVIGTILFIGAMHFEVSLVIVGAVLSVLGLSMNETIIIFDRIRENEKLKVQGGLDHVINLSVNETLPRTVLTHGTTMATQITLVIFGGEVIRPFALVMLWGVTSGLFSSMFIAPALLRYIRGRWPATPTALKGTATRSVGNPARQAAS